MKKVLTITLGFLLSQFSVHSQEYLRMIDENTNSVNEIIEEANTYFEGKDKGRGSGYKQFKRWEYKALRTVNEDGYLSSQIDLIAELEKHNAYVNQQNINKVLTTDNWEELGPRSWNATTSWNPGVGRITGISIDPSDANHIIIGANTGGVWKTTDAGATWQPLSDSYINLTVFSVTIDPSDSSVYYFGSKQGLIYKSTDAGGTWNLLGNLGGSNVNKILVHPTNSNILFASGQYKGLYRSTDAGATWTKVTSDSQSYDVEFKPGDPSIVYASGSKFFKSINSGASFTQISSSFSSGPKMIGVSINDASRVYVLEASGGAFGGFYSSSDEGASFVKLNHAGKNYFGYSTSGSDGGGQAPRDMDIAVNPNDVNEVHIAGVLTWRSLDAGVAFTCTADWVPDSAASAGIGYCHADVDIMVFDDSTLFVGTDGGIFKATDTGDLNADYYTDITTGIGIRQFYKIGVSQTSSVIVSGGAQDNGTSFYKDSTGEWIDWLGADGMESFIDKDNSNIMYGTSQMGSLYRTDNGASSFVGLSTPGSGSGNWVTPFEKDPTQSNTIYVGYNRVYKSENRGNGWFPAISQLFTSPIEELKIAASDNQTMYLSQATRLYKTEDGGATDWELKATPGGYINSIAIHPTDPDKIAVATGHVNKVFVSTDGGDSWTDYKKNLPDFNSLAIVWDDNGEDGLYLGMDYGIFYIDNTFSDWQTYSNNLPNVHVSELEINSADQLVYAGTYGRGLWASPTVYNSIGVKDLLSKDEVVMSPNPVFSKLNIKLKSAKNVQIRVFDINGKLIINIKNSTPEILNSIDVSSLNKGVYFIRLNTEKGSVTKKFIKG